MLSLCVATAAFTAPMQTSRSAVAPRAGAVDMRAKISNKMVWVTFADASQCKPNSVISGFQSGQELAIATNAKGQSFALSNKLPPTGQPATLGSVFENVIV